MTGIAARNLSDEQYKLVLVILCAAAEKWATTVRKIRGRDRHPDLVEARRYAAARMRDEQRLSYPCIGAQLGGRHHTDIMYLLGALGRQRR